jgi:hypothetical protein
VREGDLLHIGHVRGGEDLGAVRYTVAQRIARAALEGERLEGGGFMVRAERGEDLGEQVAYGAIVRRRIV